MKTKKQFDCVQMMRDIRNKINKEITALTPEQILEYIKKGKIDYDNLVSSR